AAEKEFSQLLQEQPQNAEIHQTMAVYYQARGSFAEAERSLLRALQLQPESGEILEDLAQIYIQQKQTAQAIDKINNIPETKKRAFHYELMGVVYFKAGKFKESLSACLAYILRPTGPSGAPARHQTPGIQPR